MDFLWALLTSLIYFVELVLAFESKWDLSVELLEQRLLSDVCCEPFDVVADVDNQDDTDYDATAETDGKNVNLLLHRGKHRSHEFSFTMSLWDGLALCDMYVCEFVNIWDRTKTAVIDTCVL